MHYYILIVLLMFSLTLGTAFRLPLLGQTYNFQFAEIFLIAGTFIMLIHVLSEGRFIVYVNDAVPVLWIILIVWLLLGFFWARHPLQHIGGTLAFCEGLLAYLIALNAFRRNPSSFRIAERLFTVSLVIQLTMKILPILLHANDHLSFYELKHFAVTAMGGSNYIALYLGFALIYELTNRSRSHLIFSALAGGGLVMTMSRAGLIATGVVVCLLFGFQMRKLRLKAILGILSVLGMVILITSITPLGDVLFTSMRNLASASSLVSRMALWNRAWTDFKEAPLLGCGLRWEADPHNTILRTLRDLGFIGALLFYAILFIPIERILRYTVHSKHIVNSEIFAVVLGYVTVFIHSLVEPAFFGTISQIWFGITLAYITVLCCPFQKQKKL